MSNQMPTISMFYGIVIYMYNNDHNPPHFHARYQGDEAEFDFNGDLIEGGLPRKQTKLVLAWAELHKEELVKNWELIKNGEAVLTIAPLH